MFRVPFENTTSSFKLKMQSFSNEKFSIGTDSPFIITSDRIKIGFAGTWTSFVPVPFIKMS